MHKSGQELDSLPRVKPDFQLGMPAGEQAQLVEVEEPEMGATAWRGPEANLPGFRIVMGLAQVDIQQAGTGMVVSSELLPGIAQDRIAKGGWQARPSSDKLLAAKGIGIRRFW